MIINIEELDNKIDTLLNHPIGVLVEDSTVEAFLVEYCKLIKELDESLLDNPLNDEHLIRFVRVLTLPLQRLTGQNGLVGVYFLCKENNILIRWTLISLLAELDYQFHLILESCKHNEHANNTNN